MNYKANTDKVNEIFRFFDRFFKRLVLLEFGLGKKTGKPQQAVFWISCQPPNTGERG